MRITHVDGTSETHNLAAGSALPSVFLTSTSYAACGNVSPDRLLPLAINPDGTVNSCANPAPMAATVAIYLNGLGNVGSGLQSGAVSTGQELGVPPAVTATFVGDTCCTNTLGTEQVPVSPAPSIINAVWLGQIDLSKFIVSGYAKFNLTISGAAVRDPLVNWVASR